MWTKILLHLSIFFFAVVLFGFIQAIATNYRINN